MQQISGCRFVGGNAPTHSRACRDQVAAEKLWPASWAIRTTAAGSAAESTLAFRSESAATLTMKALS